MSLSLSLHVEDRLETEAKKDITLNDQEKWYIIASQVFLPFMIAGLGMVAAGLILERVKVLTQKLKIDLVI